MKRHFLGATVLAVGCAVATNIAIPTARLYLDLAREVGAVLPHIEAHPWGTLDFVRLLVAELVRGTAIVAIGCVLATPILLIVDTTHRLASFVVGRR